MLRKRTLFLLCCVLSLSAATYLSRGPLVSTAIEWYFKGYCRVCLGGKFTYASVYHENGVWTFEQPSIATKKPLSEGGYKVVADKATIAAGIDWSSRTLDIAINLAQPVLHVGKEAQELKRVLSSPPENYNLVYVNTYFSIPDGQIIFFGKDQNLQPLHFNFEAGCRDTLNGCANLWLGDTSKEWPDLHLSLSQAAGGSSLPIHQIQLDFKQFKGERLAEVLQEIFPHSLAEIISQGDIEGTTLLSIPPNSVPYAEGRLLVRHLKLDYPQFDCQVNLPEVIIELTKKALDTGSQEKRYQTVSKAKIGEKAELIFRDKGSSFRTLEVDRGEFSLNFDEKLDFTIEGQVIAESQIQQLKMVGEGRFDNIGQNALKLVVELADTGQEAPVYFDFAITETNDQWHIAELDFYGMGKKEIAFFQHLLKKQFPHWESISVEEGTLDLKVLLHAKDYKIVDLQVENFAAHQLAFDWPDWSLKGSVGDSQGVISIDLAALKPLDTLLVDVNISQGNVYKGDDQYSAFQMKEMDGHLQVRSGIIEKSIIRGKFAGLDGTVEINGSENGTFALIDFAGPLKELALFFPEKFSKIAVKNFEKEIVQLKAKALKESELKVKGDFSVTTDDILLATVPFGFTLTLDGTKLWRDSIADLLPLDFHSLLKSSEISFSQSLIEPSLVVHKIIHGEKFFPSPFFIHHGWFQVDNLDLAKFASPFLFVRDEMHLSGCGDFRGSFNSKGCVVHYDGRDLVLDNQYLSINVKEIGEGYPQEERFRGVHVVDFTSGESQGILPLNNGTYFEKHSGLLFTDIAASIRLEEGQAILSGVETYCNGVLFSGATVHADWRKPGDGVFDIELISPKMHGKVSQVQDVFSHFPFETFVTSIPLEGTIDLTGRGGLLRLSFQEDDWQFSAYGQGEINDGFVKSDIGDIKIEDIVLGFEYDYDANKLDFSDIQGTLLVGSCDNMEEYEINVDTLRFTDYKNNEMVFNAWIGDKTRHILRIDGNTKSIDEDTVKVLINNETTHFGEAHPKEFELYLSPRGSVKNFHLAFDFRLNSLLTDLQRLIRTGIFPLSRSVTNQLNGIDKAEGDFHADFNYNSDQSLLTYNIEGEAIKVRYYAFDAFALNGKKKGSIWSIDQLKLDDISFAIDFQKQEGLWAVQFLGAQIGDFLLLGMDGEIDFDRTVMNAKVKLLDVDIGKFLEWIKFKESFGDLQINGQFQALGDIKVDFSSPSKKGINLTVEGKGSLKEAHLNQLKIGDIDQATLHYTSADGFTIEDLKTTLISLDDSSKRADMGFKKLNAHIANKDASISNFDFAIPASNLQWFLKTLQNGFPNLIAEKLSQAIAECKTNGDLVGTIDVSLKNYHPALTLKLNDGSYRLCQNDYDLSDFIIKYSPDQLDVEASYCLNKKNLFLRARSTINDFKEGTLIVTEPKGSEDPLTFLWNVDPAGELSIGSIKGQLCGIGCDINRVIAEESSWTNLNGKVTFDFNLAKELFDSSLADTLSDWKIGNGYTLEGLWKMNTNDPRPLKEKVVFSGLIKGQDFSLLGYQFSNLYAEVEHSPNGTALQKLSMVDPCGIMHIDQLHLVKKGNDNAVFSTPYVKLSNFSPCMLRSENGDNRYASKTLVINNMEIFDVSGIAGERNSIVGGGTLTFSNPSKKNLSHTIFAVPAEILTKIGLDLDVLTPIRGNVEYRIGEGKVHLTKLKDVYSKKKAAKFYLPNTEYDSYVDFDGNLNMQIRMKHYNLLFKLSELFTFNIQGTLQKPVYSLQKQLPKKS